MSSISSLFKLGGPVAPMGAIEVSERGHEGNVKINIKGPKGVFNEKIYIKTLLFIRYILQYQQN